MGTLLPFITGTIWLYVLGRFVWPLPCGLGVRAALALVLFLVAQYHWFTSRFFGSLASPELPQGVLVFLGWAFGAFLLLAMLVLLRDVAGGLIFLFARGAGRAILGGACAARLIGCAGLGPGGHRHLAGDPGA